MNSSQVALSKRQPATESQRRQVAVPAVDIYEDEAGVTLVADLPGVPRSALDIQVESDVLTLSGAAQVDLPDTLQVVHADWRTSPAFRRSFRLGREIDGAAIEASLRDGVLTLRIPKIAEARPRRIEVQAG